MIAAARDGRTTRIRRARARSGDAADAAVTVEVALLAGAAAGISIDLALFPLDTLKTRAIQGLELPGLTAFLSGSSGPLYQVRPSRP